MEPALTVKGPAPGGDLVPAEKEIRKAAPVEGDRAAATGHAEVVGISRRLFIYYLEVIDYARRR